MTREPVDEKRVTSWLKACGIFALLTAGVAAAIMLFGGRVGAALYLGLWPLIPAPVVFFLYVFANKGHSQHLRKSGAILGFLSAGILTLLAMVVGAAYGLSSMQGEEKRPLLMVLGGVLLPGISWPAAFWSAWMGHLSLRLLKV